MKKTTALLLFLCFAAACWAMGSAPEPKVKTGDASLDKALHEVDKKSSAADGTAKMEQELREQYTVTAKEMEMLKAQNYAMSERYYVCLLARHSGRSISSIINLRRQGFGWGALAKKAGVKPSELNKLRVRLRDRKRLTTKDEKKDKVKLYAPQPVRMKVTSPDGGKRGR